MADNNIPDYYALQQYYRDRARKTLRINKKAMYWAVDETFDKFTYKDDDIVQYWGQRETIWQLPEKYPRNYYVLSPQDVYYLGTGQGNKYGDDSNVEFQT